MVTSVVRVFEERHRRLEINLNPLSNKTPNYCLWSSLGGDTTELTPAISVLGSLSQKEIIKLAKQTTIAVKAPVSKQYELETSKAQENLNLRPMTSS